MTTEPEQYPPFPILENAAQADGPTILLFVIREDVVPATLTEVQILQAEAAARVALRYSADESPIAVARINRAAEQLAWSRRALIARAAQTAAQTGQDARQDARGTGDDDHGGGGRPARLEPPAPQLPPTGHTADARPTLTDRLRPASRPVPVDVGF